MGLHEGEPEDTVERHQECPQHQLYGKSHGLFHGDVSSNAPSAG